MKSKATDCGSVLTVFSSIVLLCVSSIIMIMQGRNKGSRSWGWARNKGFWPEYIPMRFEHKSSDKNE